MGVALGGQPTILPIFSKKSMKLRKLLVHRKPSHFASTEQLPNFEFISQCLGLIWLEAPDSKVYSFEKFIRLSYQRLTVLPIMRGRLSLLRLHQDQHHIYSAKISTDLQNAKNSLCNCENVQRMCFFYVLKDHSSW